jgi:phosphoribosyl 1,2-cyclic phosphodiesterase
VLRCCVLGSGSAGNALIVEARDATGISRVLVDNGFGPRALARRLARAGLHPAEIDAVLVTHEHADHAGGVARVARLHGLEVHASAGTADAAGLFGAGVDVRLLCAGQSVSIGRLQITGFEVPHDAAEPTQFVFSDGARRLGLLTDLGAPTAAVAAALAGVNALLLECNHDERMLRESDDPPFLKARIGSDHGHLSNAQAATLLAQLPRQSLNWVAAAHLSRRNNRAGLARAALAAVLGTIDDDVLVADQDLGLAWRGV